MRSNPTILLIGTVDTKSDEIGFLREHIERAGAHALVMDVGVLGSGGLVPDISNAEVAAAAGTTRERVLVCAIHQHDAPLADLQAERLIAQLKLQRSTLDLDWHAKTVDRVVSALKRSLKDASPITHLGTAETRV